jgi:hypothetical protein
MVAIDQRYVNGISATINANIPFNPPQTALWPKRQHRRLSDRVMIQLKHYLETKIQT